MNILNFKISGVSGGYIKKELNVIQNIMKPSYLQVYQWEITRRPVYSIGVKIDSIYLIIRISLLVLVNSVNCYRYDSNIPNQITMIEIVMLVVKYYIIINNITVHDVIVIVKAGI